MPKVAGHRVEEVFVVGLNFAVNGLALDEGHHPGHTRDDEPTTIRNPSKPITRGTQAFIKNPGKGTVDHCPRFVVRNLLVVGLVEDLLLLEALEAGGAQGARPTDEVKLTKILFRAIYQQSTSLPAHMHVCWRTELLCSTLLEGSRRRWCAKLYRLGHLGLVPRLLCSMPVRDAFFLTAIPLILFAGEKIVENGR